MKKMLILLMCLMLVLPMGAGAKTFDYTIEELIARQLQTGAVSLRVKLSAAAEGEAIAGVDAQTWETLKQALPPLQLVCTYMQSRRGATAGNCQVKGVLNQNDAALTSFALTGQGEQWFLQSELLPGKVYGLSRSLKTAFMNASAPEEGTWPNILRLFTAVNEADEEFAAQLERAMSDHMASLNRWLQSKTQVDISADQQLTQHISIPAAEMKQQIKAFLKELYQDEALLVLLRQIVPTPDAHAYLESGMLPLFEQVIDDLALEGDIVISRVYAGDGQLKTEEITLPFAGSQLLRSLKLIGGEKTAVEAVLADGSAYAFSIAGSGKAANGMYDGAYAGEISLKPAGAEKAFEALYDLEMTKGMEQYIEENASHERDQKIDVVLTLSPKDGESFAAQTITANVHLTAGASSTKAAYADTVLTWQDQKTGGKLTVNLNMHTNTALRMEEVDEALSVQMDTLNAAGREELISDIATQLNEQFAALLSRILSVP